MAYLLLYVDDIVLTCSSDVLQSLIFALLALEFTLSDIGPLSFFLGISVTRSSVGLFLSQAQYTKDIVTRANMTNCKPVLPLVDTYLKLSISSGPLVADPNLYRSLAGSL